MEDRRDIGHAIGAKSLPELALVEVVDVGKPFEVQLLDGVGLDVIDDEDVVVPAPVERFDEIAPDETGSAGDDDGVCHAVIIAG